MGGGWVVVAVAENSLKSFQDKYKAFLILKNQSVYRLKDHNRQTNKRKLTTLYNRIGLRLA